VLFPGRCLFEKGADSVNDVARSHAVLNDLCEHPPRLFHTGRLKLQKTAEPLER
jgi:hypothetical protein